MAKKKVDASPAMLAIWEEYSGEKGWPGEVLAVRQQDDLYAVLIRDTDSQAPLQAIQFNRMMVGNDLVWDVTDDGIEFDSIEQFTTEKLIQTLW